MCVFADKPPIKAPVPDGPGKDIEKESIEINDTDNDGIPEIKRYYVRDASGNNILVRKELDINADGRIDYTYYYTGGLAQKVIKIEVDLDFDGIVDEKRYFSPEDGSLVKKEFDLNFDGKPDVLKRYYNNELIKKDIDRNFDGAMDSWEYYQNNRLARTEIDTDFDGKPDKIGKSEFQEVYKFDIERLKEEEKPVKKKKKIIRKRIIKKRVRKKDSSSKKQ
ncbi:MAG: hypothetical protein JXA66_03990 [Oligoflexia bacterium]|nr:hypothetical protein [Oligoflexia bacterium]